MQSNNQVPTITPANFEEFAGFLMFQKNIPAEKCPLNISELTQELVDAYADEFISLQVRHENIKTVSLPRTIMHAVRCSLDNSILERRKSPEFTFMSNSMDKTNILSSLMVLNQKTVGSTEYVSASNPLVSILWLDKKPEFAGVEWQSVIFGPNLSPTMRMSFSRYRHNGDEMLLPDQILSSHVILDLYHPYIWQLILDDKLDTIKLFLNSYEYKLFVNYANSFAHKKRAKSSLS